MARCMPHQSAESPRRLGRWTTGASQNPQAPAPLHTGVGNGHSLSGSVPAGMLAQVPSAAPDFVPTQA